MAENMKQGGMAAPTPDGKFIPRRDAKPVFDEIQAIMDEAGMSEMGPAGAGAPGEQKAGGPMMGESGATPSTGGTEPAAGGGASVIADMLDVSMDKAQQLLDAAMAMPKFADMSPEQIGQMLATDMNLRMQVEKNIGAGEDMKMRKSMSEGSMSAPPAGPPPMEPTPAGGTK
jgi:hypothetical protein